MYARIYNAISLHTGGGLTYLYILNKYLDRKENVIILDFRVKKKLLPFNKAKIIFVRNNFIGRLNFSIIRILYGYKRFFLNQDSKKLIEFHLNGRPPLFRIFRSKTYIFFQNKSLTECDGFKYNISITNLKILIYIFINKFLFKLLLSKKDIIIVQTKTMYKLLSSSYKNEIIMQENVWGQCDTDLFKALKKKFTIKDTLSLSKVNNLKKNNIIFFYPAANYEHKNHERLIKAFSYLEKKRLKPYKLILTIKKNDKSLKNIYSPSNIIYLNELNFQDILHLYSYVDYLVFPSLSESYGFPLVEAKINNINIIASDLNYVYDVCDPFLVFDPYDTEDIYKKILLLLKNK